LATGSRGGPHEDELERLLGEKLKKKKKRRGSGAAQENDPTGLEVKENVFYF
jgi:hypothetical protein